MMSLWTALGRGCQEKGYREGMPVVGVHGNQKTSIPPMLYQYMQHKDYPVTRDHPVTRYEVGEANWAFRNPKILIIMEQMQAAIEGAGLVSPDTVHLLGLCCLDGALRGLLRDTTVARFRTHLARLHVQEPEENTDCQQLIDVLGVVGYEGKVNGKDSLMEQMDKAGWKQPDSLCEPGVTSEEQDSSTGDLKRFTHTAR